MGPALDRLLARPSALHLLRHILRNQGCLNIFERSVSHSTSPFRQRPTPDGELGQGLETDSQPKKSLAHTALPPRSHALKALSEQDQNPFPRLNDGADVLSRQEQHGDDENRMRPVDDDQKPTDWRRWVELLQSRKRIDGDRGVKRVWLAMKKRNILLPAGDTDADLIWSIVLGTASKQPRLARQLIEYAGTVREETGQVSPRISEILLGSYMCQTPERALHWYEELKAGGLLLENHVRALLKYTIASKHNDRALEAFRHIYTASDERGLYDECISLLQMYPKPFMVVCAWHRMLLKNSDMPSKATRDQEIVRRCFEWNEFFVHKARNQTLLDLRPSSPETLQVEKPIEVERQSLVTQQGMDVSVGDVHDIERRTISDEFCARLFATKGFPLTYTLRSVYMFGLDSIGPLALREIAARTKDVTSFSESLIDIRTAGLKIKNDSFSKALKSLAAEGRQDLFDALLASDRHPETYDDKDLQYRLLQECFDRGQLEEAHVLLKVLSTSPWQIEPSLWNQLLSVCCKLSNREVLKSVMNDMLKSRIRITPTLLRRLRSMCLYTRKRGQKPDAALEKSEVEGLSFITSLYLSIIQAGQLFDYRYWVEIMKRYGMTGRMDDLERLCLRLAQFYHPGRLAQDQALKAMFRTMPESQMKEYIATRTPMKTSGAGSSPDSARSHDMQSHQDSTVTAETEDEPLVTIPSMQLLFGSGLQRAIVAWGFQNEINSPKTTNTTPAPPTFIHGLSILKRLGALGVPLDTDGIRLELRIRLWTLYGPGRSNSRFNRQLRVKNKFSLLQRLKLIQNHWAPRRLFDIKIPRDELACDQKLYYVFLFRDFMLQQGWRISDLGQEHTLLPDKGTEPGGSSRQPKATRRRRNATRKSAVL